MNNTCFYRFKFSWNR